MGYASFILHSYYLHQEDWAPRVISEAIPGIVEGQRGQIIYGLLAWLDSNWPLSINYVQR